LSRNLGQLSRHPPLNLDVRLDPMPTFLLRSTSVSDAALYYQLVSDTLRRHIEFAYGRFDEGRAHTAAAQFSQSPYARVIEADRKSVGILHIAYLPSQLYVRLLCISPDSQRLGAGTRAMQYVLAEAAAARMSVRLKVMVSNPVKPFYERFGFRVVEQTAKWWLLEHPA
jgi:ribosomal protein S18 acetylase RimI-like enzyme